MSVIIPVILNGGSGRRLWPLSRHDSPKQFLNLLGDFTLLQDTILRALKISGTTPEQLVTVTLRDLVPETRSQLSALDAALTTHILEEPESRNTAAAFAFAAHYVRKYFGADALMWVLPSDHHIENTQALAEAVEKGRTEAYQGRLVTFGITPTRPETGFGYMRKGKCLNGSGVFTVQSFTEKPDRKTAEAYYRSENYLWNSGMHLFQTRTLLQQFERHAPETAATIKRTLALNGKGCELYRTIREEPFEKAVLEKSGDVAVVPCDPGWFDIGSWEGLWDLRAKDKNGNAVKGRVVCHGTEDSILHAESDRLVVCLGMRNAVVVDTGDVVMVANKGDSESIRKIAAALHKAGCKEALRALEEEDIICFDRLDTRQQEA